MKLCTLAGSRPELIRLSRIIPKLDAILGNNHIFIWTGQNYDPKLSDIFFRDLEIRPPNYNLNINCASLGTQISTMFIKLEEIIKIEQFDKILLLGDTNSGLSTLLFERLGIKVYHMEAGNRCGNLVVPEEVNRRMIDSIASFNLPYTPGSHKNLLNSGILENKIYESGNPIKEVLDYYMPQIDNSNILNFLDLKPNNYFLVTCHRSECVDNKKNLEIIINLLITLAEKYYYPIIVSTHPRTRNKIKVFEIKLPDKVEQIKKGIRIDFLEPFGFFDFVKLEKNALMVLSDCLHPESKIMKNNGEIVNIKELLPKELINNGLLHETVNLKISKKVSKKYIIKTKYNQITCSEHHKLFIWNNNSEQQMIEATNIKKGDRLVSFCKIECNSQENELKFINQPIYLKINEEGKKLLKIKSFGNKLKIFKSFKSNVIMGKKSTNLNTLTKVLSYLNIDKELFMQKYTLQSFPTHQRQRYLPFQPKLLNKDLAEYIGFLCGDGFCGNYFTAIYDQNIEILNYFNQQISKLFGIQSKIKQDQRNNCCYLQTIGKTFQNFIKTNFSSECETTLTHKKDISKIIQTSNNDILASYLRGLFEAEGCIYDHSIGISMCDKLVIEKIKLMLLRFGILSNYYEYTPKRIRDKSIMYILHIYEVESRKRFQQYIGFISKKKQEALNKMLIKWSIPKRNKQILRIGNFIQDRVISIQEITDEFEYIDINVSPTNTFFVNGILSHNSGTVSEESCILHKPCITIRNETERPETIECGSNIINGITYSSIIDNVHKILNINQNWTLPIGYDDNNVSDKVIKFLLGD